MAFVKQKADAAVSTFLPAPTDTFEVTITIPKQMGWKVRGFGNVVTDFTKWSVANLSYAVLHGAGQRIPDGAAIPRTDKDGRIIPEAKRDQMKGERMQRLSEFYETGTEAWEMAKRGGGDQSAVIEMATILQAMMKVAGVDLEEANRRAKVHADNLFGGDVRKALKHLATGKRVAEAIREMQEARLPEDLPDADSLIDQLAGDHALATVEDEEEEEAQGE